MQSDTSSKYLLQVYSDTTFTDGMALVGEVDKIVRLTIATLTCIAVPTLVVTAFRGWTGDLRDRLPHWRNGVGLASMVIVTALWLNQSVRWAALVLYSDFNGFLGSEWREIEMFLPAFFAYPALPLALALKGAPRLQMVSARVLLIVFYASFSYT